MNKKNEEAYLQNRISNCSNVAHLITEVMHGPGKAAPVIMQSLVFIDEIRNEYRKRLESLINQKKKKQPKKRK